MLRERNVSYARTKEGRLEYLDTLRHPESQGDFFRTAKLFRKRTAVKGRNSKIYYRTVSPEEFSIIKELARNGIRVETPLNKKYTHQRVAFRDEGISLETAWGIFPAFEIRKRVSSLILTDLPGFFAKMHSLGIAHNHPHNGNIVLGNKGLTLIDFSLAERVGRVFHQTKDGLEPRVSIDWNDPKKVFNLFKEDYGYLHDYIRPYLGGKWLDFVIALVNKYPMPNDAVRGRLLTLILKP